MTLSPDPTASVAPRQHLAGDHHRPQFHYQPPANWMNDPNGLIEWNGEYHLFYQYNPYNPFAADMHWGHAVSTDLVHWRDLPVALAPTPGGPDAGGCWSGCAVNDGGLPTLVYTGIDPQVVCLATGSPDLLHWAKHPANPVIAGPPADLAASVAGDFRDPYVWQADGAWQMVIAAKLAGRGGVIFHYRSPDLLHWDYQGVLLASDSTPPAPVWTGNVWECPNFFPLGDQWVLLVSVPGPVNGQQQVNYYSGPFDGQAFTPGAPRLLVHGSSFYAPQVMRLSDGRTVLWGWLIEGRPDAAARASGWQGVMSVPMTLAAGPGGAVQLAPAEELKALRGRHWHLDNLIVTPGAANPLGDIHGDALEIEAVLEVDADAEFGLALGRAPDGAEQTSLVYSAATGVLRVEPSSPEQRAYEAPLRLDAQGRLHLHLFLDRSVLEVFANDDTCLVARLYPLRPDSQGLALFARHGRVTVKALDVWAVKSIW